MHLAIEQVNNVTRHALSYCCTEELLLNMVLGYINLYFNTQCKKDSDLPEN